MGERNAGKVLASAALLSSALALFQSRQAKAAEDGKTLPADAAALELLAAIAQSNVETAQFSAELLEATTDMALAVVPNADTIISTRVLIAAVLRAYNLPDIVVPDDMELQIKGWPTNAGIIYVGYSRATAFNIESAWPLLANEAIGYRIHNADEIWVSGTVAGDLAAITVEQRKGGR